MSNVIKRIWPYAAKKEQCTVCNFRSLIWLGWIVGYNSFNVTCFHSDKKRKPKFIRSTISLCFGTLAVLLLTISIIILAAAVMRTTDKFAKILYINNLLIVCSSNSLLVIRLLYSRERTIECNAWINIFDCIAVGQEMVLFNRKRNNQVRKGIFICVLMILTYLYITITFSGNEYLMYIFKTVTNLLSIYIQLIHITNYMVYYKSLYAFLRKVQSSLTGYLIDRNLKHKNLVELDKRIYNNMAKENEKKLIQIARLYMSIIKIFKYSNKIMNASIVSHFLEVVTILVFNINVMINILFAGTIKKELIILELQSALIVILTIILVTMLQKLLNVVCKNQIKSFFYTDFFVHIY